MNVPIYINIHCEILLIELWNVEVAKSNNYSLKMKLLTIFIFIAMIVISFIKNTEPKFATFGKAKILSKIMKPKNVKRLVLGSAVGSSLQNVASLKEALFDQISTKTHQNGWDLSYYDSKFDQISSSFMLVNKEISTLNNYVLEMEQHFYAEVVKFKAMAEWNKLAVTFLIIILSMISIIHFCFIFTVIYRSRTNFYRGQLRRLFRSINQYRDTLGTQSTVLEARTRAADLRDTQISTVPTIQLFSPEEENERAKK